MIKSEELTNPNSCLNKAKCDEMCFVLLGRDSAAPAAVRKWVSERIRLGKNASSDPQIVEALKCADEMNQQYAERLQRRVDDLEKIKIHYDAIIANLASRYRRYPSSQSDVATICDTLLDPSGRLLGEVRDAASDLAGLGG